MTPTNPGAPELRAVAAATELRQAPEGSKSPGTIAGYAATFDQPSCDLGGFTERIAPGAFAACMGDDVRCLRNHQDDAILGRSTNGTLRFEEDKDGLRYECDLPDTTHGRDTAEMVRSGLMTGCSFQFRVAPKGDSWDLDGDTPRRTVHKVGRLYDVGPVTNPAYESTRVDLRSLDAARAAVEAASAESVRVSISQAEARQRLAEAFLAPRPDHTRRES